MMKIRSRSLVSIWASTIAVLLALGAQAQQPKQGGRLTAVYSGETHTLFAPGGGGGNPLMVSTKIIERLVRLESDLGFTGQLAESWSIEDGGKSYVFKLRRNATWHDGKPFTAEDAAFNALDHWRKFAGNPALRSIASAEIVDTHTLRIGYAKPTPEFLVLASLSGSEAQMVPKHLYATGEIAQNPANNAPIGTGPFKFKEWRRGSHVELVRNESYWDAGKPHLDSLIIRYLQDPASRAAAFEVGEVDLGVSSPFSTADMQRLSRDKKYLATDGGGLQEFMVVEFNTRNPILADRRVRQAIAHAVDRSFVVETLMSGFGRPGTGTVSDVYKIFYNADVPRYAPDAKRAAALLDEAGHPRKAGGVRFELKLVVGPWYPENTRTASYLQQSLGDVGIKVAIVTPDRAGAIKQIYSDYDFDLSISNNVSYADPLQRSVMLFTTANIIKTPFRNASGYSNPVLDKLVDDAANEMDATRRVDMLRRVQMIVAEDLPVLVMAYKRNMNFARDYVRAHSNRPEWMYDSWKDVWLDK